jgi:hypothetical protein
MSESTLNTRTLRIPWMNRVTKSLQIAPGEIYQMETRVESPSPHR